MKLTKEKNKEVLILLIFCSIMIIVGSVYSISYGFSIRSFAIYNFLFYLIPPIFLLYKNRSMIKPILIFTIAMSLFLGLFLNHFARVNKVWEAFPKPDLFYYFYWEDLVWMFLWVLFSITLYASFFVRHFPKTVTKRMKLFFAVFSGITLIYMLLVFAFPVLRGKYTDYAYLEMGISALPSIIIVLYGERKKLPKLLKFGVISFFLSLFIEIVGKRHELWGFKGEYAGWVNIFGAAFPIEEFVIWMVLGGISLAAYYEIFLGNKE